MPKESVKTKVHGSLVLFGLDERKQPRGARFKSQDETVVTRMARDLGLRIAVLTRPNEVSVASRLCAGDTNVARREAMPEISQTLYQTLNSFVGGEIGVICTSLPKHWDIIGPSHLVLAEDKLKGGWWPAWVVMRRARWLVLNWRDYPDRRCFSRRVHAVALLRATPSLRA
jgi:hypothetical protein